MDPETENNAFVALCVAAGLILSITIISLAKRTVAALTVLRVLSTVPYGIYGGIAVQIAFHRQFASDGHLLGKTSSVVVSQDIHGVVGIILAVWSVCSFIPTNLIEKRRWPSSSTWDSSRRSVGYFYVLLIDFTFFTLITIALAFGSTYIPWTLNKCGDYDIRSFPRIPASYSDCKQSLLVQVMALIDLFVLGSQMILMIPMTNLPPALRAAIFHIIGAISIHKPPLKHKMDSWRDVEKEMVAEYEMASTPSITSVLRNDNITANLAKYLHFDDLSNISIASKTMRLAVFRSRTSDPSARYEMLCEKACTKGAKTECWACAKVTCEDCKVATSQMPTPRTQDHLNSCKAVCSKCYILNTNVEQPAPLGANWSPKDLATQHIDCQAVASKQQHLTYPVDLCPSCSKLTLEQAVGVREMREEKALKETLRRRIRCGKCERALPMGKTRWWICEKGSHDCRWDGHEVRR